MRKIALLLPLVIAVAAMIVIALTQQHQPDIAEAANDKVDLDFIIVANPGDTVGTPWTEAQVKNLIAGANDIYAQNLTGISFNWPKQANQDPILRFKYIDDPQKAIGGPGDVKVPPLSPQVPYLGEHLGAGEAAGAVDPKNPAEAEIICNNAWANANPGTLPVALVQHFTDLTGAKASLLGVAYTNIGTKQPGFCILMSVQAKDNPQTFAHELGHVLCLAHVDTKTDNLMHPIKESGGTLLNAAQVNQLCPKQMQAKLLEEQPGEKIPTPNLTPVPAQDPEVSALCVDKSGQQDGTKCKHDLFQSFTIVGDANFAQDTDKNDTAGYHGVDVQVTWPSGLGDVEKSSDMFCPPGGQAGKLPILETGKWGGICGLQTQDDPDKIPDCPTQPDEPFPAPGCDTFDSFATFDVNLTNPALGSLDCEVSGATQITRSAVLGAPDLITTEIVYMHLTGLCDPGAIPITVVESPTLNSIGTIIEQKNNTPGTLEFPANSTFDVYVVVQGTPLGNLHNNDPIVMKCKIDDIPPYLCAYGANTQPNLWNEANDKVVGTIKTSEHTPKKTLEGISSYEIELTCVEEGTFTVNVSATFTREAKDTVGPVTDSVDINCNTPGKQAWPGDTDGDGCPDVNENQGKPMMVNGGGRDYLNQWDYYDVTGDDAIVLIGDITGVIAHFAPGGYPVGQEAEYAVYDRGPTSGPNPWNLTAPDGVIVLIGDITGVIRQFNPGGCTDPSL